MLRTVAKNTKVTNVPLGPTHFQFLKREQEYLKNSTIPNPPFEGPGYRINRGLDDLAEQSHLSVSVNLFRQLERLIKETDRVVEFLEGGCGEAVTLTQIKKAFAEKVRVTGITLNSRDIEPVLKNPTEPKIDELIIGPVETHKFDRNYDFILDFFGANYYFGAKYENGCPIISTYGRILAPGGMVFVRFNDSEVELIINTYRRIFSENQLEIVTCRSSRFDNTDFLLRSTK